VATWRRFHAATSPNPCSYGWKSQKIEFAGNSRKVFGTDDEPFRSVQNILTVIPRNDSRLDEVTARPVLKTLGPRVMTERHRNCVNIASQPSIRQATGRVSGKCGRIPDDGADTRVNNGQEQHVAMTGPPAKNASSEEARRTYTRRNRIRRVKKARNSRKVFSTVDEPTAV